jgi:Putative prokaryotic signal transducing protein
MICPECGTEYREGFTHCNDCDVDLVEPIPSEPDIELVRVYSSSNPALIPFVESLLTEAGIEFMKKFDGVQDFFAAGRMLGINQIVGPVEFWVRSDDAAQAAELLAGVDESREVVDLTDDPVGESEE